jgi:hypothetical protein
MSRKHGKTRTIKRPRKLGFLPHWRKMTWLFNIVFFGGLAYIIASGAQSNKATDCGSLSQHDCQSAADVGAGIGIAALVIMWVVFSVLVGLLWLMTRPSRHCPVCGAGVKRGSVQCPNSNCRYDFVAQASPLVGPGQPPAPAV